MVLSVFILELISTNKKKLTIVKMDLRPDDNQKCTRTTVKKPFATKEKAYQTLHINIKYIWHFFGIKEGLGGLGRPASTKSIKEFE